MPRGESLQPTQERDQQGGVPGIHTNPEGATVLTDRFGQTALPDAPELTANQQKLASQQGTIHSG